MADDKLSQEQEKAWADVLGPDPNKQQPDPTQGGPLTDEQEESVYREAAGEDNTTPLGDIRMVLNVPVQLSVELGRTKVPIKYILQLAQGSVVELDSMAGGPMDVLINGYLIAQGEVVVVNEKFGIRLTDVVTPAERLRRASREYGS